MIEGGCKEVDGGRPEAKKMTKGLRTKGPFGTDDLILATQRVGEDIHLAWDELRNRLNSKVLTKPEDRLSHGVERGGASTPLLLEVCQGGGVVREHRHHMTTKRRKEAPQSQQNCQKHSVIDGKPR